MSSLPSGPPATAPAVFDPGAWYGAPVSRVRARAMGVLRFTIKTLSGQQFSDTSSGFRAFNREAALGLVVESRGCREQLAPIFEMWLDAGLELGNHTFSHVDLHGP